MLQLKLGGFDFSYSSSFSVAGLSGSAVYDFTGTLVAGDCQTGYRLSRVKGLTDSSPPLVWQYHGMCALQADISNLLKGGPSPAPLSSAG